MTTMDDGRSADWPQDVTSVWESVLDHGPLSGPSVARLYLALCTLADAAELLALASSIESSRDIIAAYAGIRAARKAASDLVRELTASPTNGTKKVHHGHRPQRSN